AHEPSPAAPRAFAENTAPASEAPSAPVHVRFYSLDRAYGLQPDPIPIPKRHPYVLIGPAENPTANKSAKDDSSSAADADADAGKPSAGGDQATP
ncbi:MAG: hypothetical protein ACREEW_01410, partial [Caulobacteraceae bacterium]